MILDYYKKNPSATQSLKGSLYEEKIINLIKTKIKINSKEIETKEAEKIIADFNKPNIENSQNLKPKSSERQKTKSKKLVKSNQ